MLKDYYKTLGINPASTTQEIRRAYRILARRYHPDLNPGQNTGERFREIVEAYEILCDQTRRRLFDGDYEKFRAQAFSKNSSSGSTKVEIKESLFRYREKPPQSKTTAAGVKSREKAKFSLRNLFSYLPRFDLFPATSQGRREHSQLPRLQVSVIEASITLKEAIFGTKKAIEILEPEGRRKISIRIPAGTRNGSVLRLKSANYQEELVLVAKVAPHPQLSLQRRGLVLEVPISISEAVLGASVTIPTLEEQVCIRIPPGTQSGFEVRVKEKGVPSSDISREDLVVRFMIKVPEAHEAPGLREKVGNVEEYYQSSVRSQLPKSLTDIL